MMFEPDTVQAEADIKAFCKTHLHEWKCPKEIIYLDEIPSNTMGKILEEEVKKIFVERFTF